MGLASSSLRKTDIEAGESLDGLGGGRSSFRRTKGCVDNKMKDLGRYLPLYKATIEGKWKDTRKFLDEDPEALTAKITIASETALHIGVGTGKALDFVEMLVRRMSPENVAITDQNGETALSVAAIVGNIEAAKLLVSKNPDLPYISGKSGSFPIHWAAQYGQREMVLYLWGITKGAHIQPSPFSGASGGKLLVSVIVAEFYDIAYELVKRYPEMATVELDGHSSPLTVLAGKPGAFQSSSHSTCSKFINIVAFWRARNTRFIQRTALKLVRILCMEIMELDDARAFSLLQEPLHLAAKLGIPEIIEEIVKAFPPAIWSSDEQNRNVFQLAVLHRRENVFNLIYQMSDYRHFVTRYIDPQGNNILHLAGKLPSPDRLNLVSGTALQLQRELQWYREVEKFVQPAQKEAENDQGKTPVMVFREEHQELIKQGEKSMKNTATACTVVASLAATVVFASAIQVPGGNAQDGLPTLSKEAAFTVFAVTDALSLFTSVGSILMFLSILTSRYSINDFLCRLPSLLIIGLALLCIYMLSMMAAFSTTLYLVLGLKRSLSIIPIGVVVISSMALFVILPPLVQIVRSTFGRGIFRKQNRRMLH